MKKNFSVIAILMVAAVELSASDVSDLLDKEILSNVVD